MSDSMRKPHKFKIEVKEEKSAPQLLAFSPSEGLVACGRIGSGRAGEGVISSCILPDGRSVCSDQMGNLSVYHPSTLTKLNKVPEKEFRNDFKGLLRALPDGRIIVSKGGCNNFVFNVNTGEKHEIDLYFPHSDQPLATLRSKEGIDYIYVHDMGPGTIRVYRLDALEEPDCAHIIGYEDQEFPDCRKYESNNLTVVGDKVVVAVGGARQSAGFVFLWMENGKLYNEYKKCKAVLPYVCGNGHYLALGDPYQNLQFGVVNQSSSDEQKSCFEPIHSLEINSAGEICPVIGAPMFCFLSPDREKNKAVMYVVNCETKYVFSLNLPIGCKSSLNMSAEGLITYLSENGQLIVFKYQPLAKKLVKNLVLDHLAPDPTNLVMSYLDCDMSDPVLSKEIIKITKEKIDTQKTESYIKSWLQATKAAKTLAKIGILKFKDESHVPAIKKILETTDDVTRYFEALDFIKYHAKNRFARELAEVMVPNPKDVLPSADLKEKSANKKSIR